ncbi:protease inhibitor I42 family protein [Nocardia sp. NPDC004260]
MRKSLLVLPAGSAAGCGMPDVTTESANSGVRMGEAGGRQQRPPRMGRRLMIAHPANSSAAYSGSIAKAGATVAKQDGAADLEPDSPAPGAGKRSVWSFVGVASCASPLTMEYARPWEPGSEPARTFSPTIEVER